ncbi:hypothetical protein [Glacieibacterium sp.]|uniref:hypothetical protein n=1 Tax=Glacieibacterium sp. TaxID=2860237 RepID=UPI003AFFE984
MSAGFTLTLYLTPQSGSYPCVSVSGHQAMQKPYGKRHPADSQISPTIIRADEPLDYHGSAQPELRYGSRFGRPLQTTARLNHVKRRRQEMNAIDGAARHDLRTVRNARTEFDNGRLSNSERAPPKIS